MENSFICYYRKNRKNKKECSHIKIINLPYCLKNIYETNTFVYLTSVSENFMSLFSKINVVTWLDNSASLDNIFVNLNGTKNSFDLFQRAAYMMLN